MEIKHLRSRRWPRWGGKLALTPPANAPTFGGRTIFPRRLPHRPHGRSRPVDADRFPRSALTAGIPGTCFMGGLHAQRLMKQEDAAVTAICVTTLDKAKQLKSNLKIGEAARVAIFQEFIKRSLE